VQYTLYLDDARQLSTFVQLTANGDIEFLLSSGFNAGKGRGPVGPVNTPLNLRLTQGSLSGVLNVCFKRDGRNSRMFGVQHAEAPDGPYTDHAYVSGTRTTIVDLTPGKMYWVRVRACGAGGTSEWSAPVCKMVI
jgi:hypothetical protein